MEFHIRKQLEELAEALHLHKGPGEDKARVVSGEVRAKIEGSSDEGGAGEELHDTLTLHAIELENEHPELARIIRRAIDALGAAGI